MTGIAGIGTVNVRGTLTRRYHTVMTFRTGTNDLGMIYVGCRHRHPGGRKSLMAGITKIR